jgi:hypothetical protein
MTVDGEDGGNFSTDLVLPATVDAGSTLDVVVTFSPDEQKDYSADFGVVADVGTVTGISVEGSGVMPLVAVPSPVLFYAPTLTNYAQNVVVINLALAGTLKINSISFTNPSAGRTLFATPLPALPLFLASGTSLTIRLAFLYPYHGFTWSDVLRLGTDLGNFDIPVNCSGA